MRGRIPLILAAALAFVLIETGFIVFWMLFHARRTNPHGGSEEPFVRSLRIGILPEGGSFRSDARKDWTRLLSELSDRTQIRFVPYFTNSRGDILNGFRNGALDLIYVNAATYIEIRKDGGVGAVGYRYGENRDDYCVIVVRSDGPEFIEETKGFRMTFTSVHSITGFLAPSVYLHKKLDCNLDEWFTSVSYSGNDAKSVEDLLAGKTDIIAVSRHVLKEFSARHSEGTDEIKIIWMFRRLPPSALCISPLLGDETVGILKDALIRDVSVFREAHENGIFLVPIDFRYEREIEEFSRFLESMPQQTENARNELRTE